MLNKKTVDDINVKGKKVLVRCDFNVPVKDGVITDENRITASLPTIRKLMDDGAKVILCSHMGKPKGEAKPELSLAPVAERLSEKLPKLEQQAPLRLASSITIAVHFFPYFLKQFARIFPETPVETQVVSASCAADLLREGKADLALLEGVMPEGPFIGRVFGSYGIRAFGSPEFFTRTEPMSMEELTASTGSVSP